MKTSTLTLQQIRQEGLKALHRELGAVGMVRFLQQFEAGQGDYSVERHEWLDQDTVREFAAKIQHKSGN